MKSITHNEFKISDFFPQMEIPMKYVEKEGLANKNLRKRSLAYKKFMYF